MPETFNEYIEWEIAISTQSYSPLASGHERVQEGDIVTIRRPLGYIGTKESSLFIWLRIEGEDTSVMEAFRHPEFLPDTDTRSDSFGDPLVYYDKKRFRIPLERLKEILPRFDLDRARDPLDDYQPFLPIDEDDFHHLDSPAPAYTFWGLVFDKNKMSYL